MQRKSYVNTRARMQLALRIALLALPILCWSAIFLTVAGVWSVQMLVKAVSDSVQTAVALVCPFLVLVLGASALEKRVGREAKAKDGNG